MDYNNNANGWAWQGEDYCLQEGPILDPSKGLWNGMAQGEEDISYMFDETTPTKDCGDLTYHVSNCDTAGKELDQSGETFTQIKRRRVLHFDTDVLDVPLCDEDISSTFINSKERDDSVGAALSEISDWVSVFADDTTPYCNETLDQSSEGWLADCLNDTEMHFSPDDLSLSEPSSDAQFDITEICNPLSECETSIVQDHPSRAHRNVVFKGRKSYMQPPTKLASSVVYPFAFIKPCGVHGDVTLKDINQKILTPPPSKSKHQEDPCISYPTSALTGKPVVGKTKIRTEGGKGSITIMRTRG